MYCSRHEQFSCEQNRNVLSSWSLHSGRGDRPRGREIRKIDGTQGGGSVCWRKRKPRKGTGRGDGLAVILTEVVGEGCMRS